MAYDPNAPKSTLNIPSYFRIAGSGSQIGVFDKTTGKIQVVDIVDQLVPDSEKKSLGSYGAQQNLALQRFQSQYGKDFNTLQELNYGDAAQRIAETYGFRSLDDVGGGAYTGNLGSLLGTTPSITGITKDIGAGQPTAGIGKEIIPGFSIDGTKLPQVTPADIARNTQPNLPNYTPSPITLDQLSGSNAPSFQPPNYPQMPSIAGLGGQTPTPQLGPQEKNLQDMGTRLGKLYEQTIGKPAFQAEQEKLFGVDTAQKTISDYTAKLNALKLEAASIDPILKTGAAERGVTTGLFSAQYNYQARENTINALTTGALLAMAQGQLSNAQMQADRAVQAKYGPMIAEIEALEANMNIIKSSPAFSAEEKQRAAAMEMQIYQQKQALATAQQNTQDIWDVIKSTSPNITNFKPTPQYPTVSIAWDAMSKAKTPQEALNIAAQTGILTKAQENWSAPYLLGGDYVQKNTQTGQIRVAVNVPAGGGGTTGGTLSLSEAKSLGLPTQLVGKTEEQVLGDLSNPTPPLWFRQMLEEQRQQSVTPQTLQQEWDNFRNKLNNQFVKGQSSSSNTNAIDFNNL